MYIALHDFIISRSELKDFVLSKSHKKILKTMNKFLRDGVKDKVANSSDSLPIALEDSVADKEYLKGARRDLPSLKMDVHHRNPRSDTTPRNDQPNQSKKSAENTTKEDLPQTITDRGNPKKKKLMRLEKRQAKLAAKGLSTDPIKVTKAGGTERKTLEEFLKEEPQDGKHKLKVSGYLIVIIELNFNSGFPQVTLVPSNSTPAKSSYDLYTKYQIAIHHDPPSKLSPESYQRFLCTTPLKVIVTLQLTWLCLSGNSCAVLHKRI